MVRRAIGIVRSNQGDPATAVEFRRAAMAAAPNAQSRALVRLGRWTEVAGLLARHPLPDTLPVGRLQLAMEKRPLHFDISSADRACERSHLVSLGASIVQEFEQHTWMRGPEGNDFCLTDA